MKFIEEIVVEVFLPTYRSLLAERLEEKGLTQSEIAEQLGVSQSAVSKYVHGEVERHPRIADDERITGLVDRIAEGLAEGTMTRVQALVETEVLVRELQADDVLAELHGEAVPALRKYPDAHSIYDPSGGIQAREQVLADLRRALGRLERTGGIAGYLPQVGSNLVYALEDAETIDDVAAVPGRILDIKGRAMAPTGPEFGASDFVATVLLAARRGGSDHRAALNVTFDPDLMHWLEAEGYRSVEVEPEADLEAAVEAAIQRTPEAAVLYHRAGTGIEANVYLLGEEPGQLVDVVRDHLDHT